MKKSFLALCLSVWSAMAFTAPLQGINFSHKDWEVACDNTGTCRVAGYHRENERENLISVLLTRPAGTPTVQGKLILANENQIIAPKTVELWLNRQKIGTLVRQPNDDNFPLSAQQSQKIMAALKKRGLVQVRVGKTVFSLSNEGAAAVWLKADEFQQFGKLKPQAKPIIKKPQTFSGSLKITPPEQQQMVQLLRQKVNAETCPLLYEADAPNDVALYRLNPQALLVEAPCWRGAYNASSVYAVMDNARQSVQQIAATDGNSYDNGEIESFFKGRGLGDCFASKTYTWNGKQFVHTSETTTGLCRGILAAWRLPTLIYDVK